ncbi:MAG: ribosome-associated translation inhibitor RaiA [Flavobacteriales bacterium]|nr:ribosome-associated translation inhibitor RaiA [Flavobacteriales bacterium]
MKVTIHAIHFDADKDLVNFIQERVNKLEHFYDGIIGGEVFLRVEKSNDNQNKVAEIKLQIPGKELFAKRQCKSFEEATDTALDAIKSQMKKHKEKKRSVMS